MNELSTNHPLFSIGHSTHSLPIFLSLLQKHSLQAIADVRSIPYSRFNPQFNRENLARFLESNSIRYVYLGEELGAKHIENCRTKTGLLRYRHVLKSPIYQKGIQRIVKGNGKYRLALMCAEHDPVVCHRTILLCRSLKELIDPIWHILRNGQLESLNSVENRLLKMCQQDSSNLFCPSEEMIEQAYDIHFADMAGELNSDE